MKTFVKVLALSLVAVMMCAVLVSCGGPNADPEKAEKALKDAGYEAEYTEVGVGGVKGILVAGKGDDGIWITYYDSAEDANKAWEETEEDLKEMLKDEEDVVIKKSGKMIYYGTKQAIKDAK